MHLPMLVWMCLCFSACVRCAWSYTALCMCMWVFVFARTHAHYESQTQSKHARTCACACVHTHTHTHTHIYIQHTCKHTHTQTHKHQHKLSNTFCVSLSFTLATHTLSLSCHTASLSVSFPQTNTIPSDFHTLAFVRPFVPSPRLLFFTHTHTHETFKIFSKLISLNWNQHHWNVQVLNSIFPRSGPINKINNKSLQLSSTRHIHYANDVNKLCQHSRTVKSCWRRLKTATYTPWECYWRFAWHMFIFTFSNIDLFDITHKCIYIYIHIYICIYVCTYWHIPVYSHKCIRVCVCVKHTTIHPQFHTPEEESPKLTAWIYNCINHQLL